MNPLRFPSNLKPEKKDILFQGMTTILCWLDRYRKIEEYMSHTVNVLAYTLFILTYAYLKCCKIYPPTNILFLYLFIEKSTQKTVYCKISLYLICWLMFLIELFLSHICLTHSFINKRLLWKNCTGFPLYIKDPTEKKTKKPRKNKKKKQQHTFGLKTRAWNASIQKCKFALTRLESTFASSCWFWC